MVGNTSFAAEYLKIKRRLFDKYYGFLNKEQRDAVYTTEGSVLILAGAGSGKTTVLVNRIVFIVKYGNAYYSEYVPHDLDENKIKSMREALLLEGEELERALGAFSSAPCAPWNMLAFTFTNKAASEIKKRLASALGSEDAANHTVKLVSSVDTVGLGINETNFMINVKSKFVGLFQAYNVTGRNLHCLVCKLDQLLCFATALQTDD